MDLQDIHSGDQVTIVNRWPCPWLIPPAWATVRRITQNAAGIPNITIRLSEDGQSIYSGFQPEDMQPG